MKFGFRKLSLKKSIKSSTTGRLKRSVKSSIDPTYGKKGIGLIKNPKKAVYNKVYNKTSFSIWDIFKSKDKAGVQNHSIKQVEQQSAMSQIENHNRIIQDSLNIMNTTKKPEIFFTRFDLVLDNIDVIIGLSKQYEGIKFTGEHPIDAKQRVIDSKVEYINLFIGAYYKSVHEKITSLKTDKAKLNNINKFKSVLAEEYSHHLSSENMELIHKLYHETLEEFNL